MPDLERALTRFVSSSDARFQSVEAKLRNHTASLHNLENQVGQIAKTLAERLQGSLPSNTIGMWIAHGYIQEIEGSSKTLEDLGEEYWLELEARGFIEKVYGLFKMHDLLHDLARSVSHGETYIFEGRKDEEIPKDVCHLYVHSSFDVELVRKTNNLRTLILYEAGDIHAILCHKEFKKIRVLVIFHTNLQELPDNIAHLKHLQYLDVTAPDIKYIPESLCTLYLLRMLKLVYSSHILLFRSPPTLPSRFHNLINLRRFCLPSFCYLYDFGFAQSNIYYVDRRNDYHIAQLRNMNELRGELLIEHLEDIVNTEEMMKTKYLKEKRHIKVLSLIWTDTSDDCKHDLQEQTLEALEPHPSLKYLRIDGYMGFKSPNWLMTPEFQRLEKIKLNGCKKWARLPAALGLLPSLKSLELSGIENMTIEVDYFVTKMYPSLQSLEFKEATLSFEGMSSSVTGQNHNHFPKLTSLTIKENEVNGLHLPLFSALKYLEIENSRVVFDQLVGCLNGVSSLLDLVLNGAKIQIFPTKVMATLHALENLNISNCNELISLEGLQALPSLEQLSIVGCSKFISWGTEEEMTEDGLPLPNLQKMKISWCEDLETLPAWLPRLLLLDTLIIKECPKLKSWVMEEEMTTLPNLQKMKIKCCKDLETLPAWLPHLPLLNQLIISECPKFKSWSTKEEEITEEGLLLPNLQKMKIEWCEDLDTLPAWLPCLPSLNELIIKACPKIHSLPQGGLPKSIKTLQLVECERSLTERCQQEGSLEWQMIQHIPHQQLMRVLTPVFPIIQRNGEEEKKRRRTRRTRTRMRESLKQYTSL